MRKLEVSPAPFVKWVGGKRQLYKEIIKHIPVTFSTYYEPFVGGGAVLFKLQPDAAVINDTNPDLVNLYRTIKLKPDSLIEDLKRHKNEKEYYYNQRGIDRDARKFSELSDVERASRFIYLNKTCYNGLYRVNRRGQFNTPFGRYKAPNIVNEKVIRAVSSYLNSCEIEIMNTDFEIAVEQAASGDFVYFDPPYDPVSQSANFTSYTTSGFSRDEQIRLRSVCDSLNNSGVKFLLSNSATPFIRDLYSDYDVNIIKAGRAVNSVASKRGSVEEVLVRNY